MFVTEQAKETMRITAKLTIILLALSLSAFGAPKPKIAKDLDKVDKNKVVDVIIQFDKSLDNVNLAKIRAKVVTKAKKGRGRQEG